MALGRRQLVSMITAVLCLGFMVTALVNYVTARNLIREAIIGSELPLTSDNIYSEIQKDLIRPIFISSMMSGDTFLRDWMLAGEKDAAAFLESKGVSVTTPDVAAFRARVLDAFQNSDFAKSWPAGLLDRIKAA